MLFRSEVACSSGTYIRTLAADMARALGTCAHLAALTRVQSGTFRLEDAVTVEDVKRLHDAGCAHSLITPMEALLAHYPAVWVRPYAQVRARNGGALCARDVDADALAEKPYRVYDKQGLLALCQGVRDQASGQVVLRPKVML